MPLVFEQPNFNNLFYLTTVKPNGSFEQLAPDLYHEDSEATRTELFAG